MANLWESLGDGHVMAFDSDEPDWVGGILFHTDAFLRNFTDIRMSRLGWGAAVGDHSREGELLWLSLNGFGGGGVGGVGVGVGGAGFDNTFGGGGFVHNNWV